MMWLNGYAVWGSLIFSRQVINIQVESQKFYIVNKNLKIKVIW